MGDTSRTSPLQHYGLFNVVGQEGIPPPAQRPRGPKLKFTAEDDQLLIDLKEKRNLDWKQIADFFPGRSSGTLQVRYCTKLKAKTTVWTDDLVQKLRHAMQEYENDRWRIISSKVGSGFSPAACKEKAAEIEAQDAEEEDQSGCTQSQLGATKTVNLKQDQESLASMYNDAEFTMVSASSGESGYKSGLQHEWTAKLPHHHPRQSSISQGELGERDQFLLETRKQMMHEHEATDRHDHKKRQRKLKDRAEKRERLHAQRREEIRREEEAEEMRRRERAERRKRRYLEQAEREKIERELRSPERKEKAEETTTIRRLVENRTYQIPRSGGPGLPKPSTSLRTDPVTDPVVEPQLPSKQSQKLSIASLTPTAEDARKTFEPLEHIRSRPTSPILLPQADSISTDDRPLEVQRVQAMVGPVKELVLFSKRSKSDVSEIFTVIDFLPASDTPVSGLASSIDRSAGDAEEEEHSFVEMDESDEASEEGKVSVKSALDTAMNIVKGLLLRELVDYALSEASDTLEGSGSSSSRSHAGSPGSSASPSLSSYNSSSQTPPRRKRTRGSGRDSDDGGGDESDNNNQPKKKNKKDQLLHRRLMCPFYQRQPEKYTKAACRGKGFADIAKLKDHIKRVHTQPLRCSRCWLEMKSEDAYSKHLQQENICKKKAEPQEDRIQPQILKQRLDFKKAPYANARNVEEKWKILFSVLFPHDTNIPSPYEQQGISPRLERALSEALEEELTRELALVLKPIMSRIKELIPVIIENCRLKLMRNPLSSDDETVFTPSAVLFGVGSRDSEPGSSKNQSGHWGSTDFSSFYPDTSSEMPNLHGGNNDDSFDIGNDGGLFALLGGFPSDGTPPTEGSSTVSTNTCGIAFRPCDFVEGLAQQSNVYLPSSQLSTWPLLGAGWDSGSRAHGKSGDKQPGGAVSREREPPPEWDFMMKDFDFSQFSSR